MAKKEKEVTQNKPVKIRQQTADEVRKRLRNQGQLKSEPKKEDGGVRELGDEEALVKAAERNNRKERESRKNNKLVRPLNKKDIALHLAAEKKRKLENEETEEPNRVLTKDDIDARNGSDEGTEGLDKKCPKCGQIDDGQELRGEQPCPDCGLPTVHDPDSGPDNADPVEIFAKDVVSFKDDDGAIVTGKVQRVTPKNEAIIDVKDGDDEYTYTVSCDILTKEPKEGE